MWLIFAKGNWLLSFEEVVSHLDEELTRSEVVLFLKHGL